MPDAFAMTRPPHLAPVPDAPDPPPQDAALIVDVPGYDGPLDLLLTLARTQKVDLMQISVLALAEQYLAFVEQARALRIELAADYLVMAAWLAFLKSRLLLPPDPQAEGPSAEDMAAHLAFQLERLQAMRHAAAQLMARDRLGQDRFARGAPETVSRQRRIHWQAGLIDLMRAYARLKTRGEFRPYAFDRRDIYTMEQALDRMRNLIGFAGDWTDLSQFLPDGWQEAGPRRRSATAATFAASLELAKQGRVDIRQSGSFAPISLRRRHMTDAAPLFRPPPIEEQERMVEALLFAATEPLRSADLAARMPAGCDPAEAVARLRLRYAGRGVELVRVGDAWAFRTAGDLGFLMQHQTVEQRRLSRAATETLAIVAYHQPVTRAEIEDIRGVAVSRGTLDQLIEIGWVRIGRRRQTPGRPVTFVVTEVFLDHFGLENTRDLPGLGRSARGRPAGRTAHGRRSATCARPVGRQYGRRGHRPRR